MLNQVKSKWHINGKFYIDPEPINHRNYENADLKKNPEVKKNE